MEDFKVFLPIVCTIDTSRAVRGVKADALGRVKRPSTNVDLASSLIRQNQTRSAEDIALDVHLAPSFLVIVG